MHYTFTIGSMDKESGAANNAAFEVNQVCLQGSLDEHLDHVGRTAELLFQGYEAMFPLSERHQGEELTLVGVEGFTGDEPEGEEGIIIGYYDAHFQWEPIVGDK